MMIYISISLIAMSISMFFIARNQNKMNTFMLNRLKELGECQISLSTSMLDLHANLADQNKMTSDMVCKLGVCVEIQQEHMSILNTQIHAIIDEIHR